MAEGKCSAARPVTARTRRSGPSSCETCDNYNPAVEFIPALTDQLTDIHALQADAEQRGWTSESDRHSRVAAALQGHLERLDKQPAYRQR